MNSTKKHFRPLRFISKYGRLIIGGAIIAAVLLMAIFAPVVATHDPGYVDTKIAKQSPSAEHIFGTDTYGRDIFSRVVYGSRSTLIVAIGAQVVVTVFGALLGLLCGYYSKLEKYVMRVLDAFSTIPNLLLSLLMVSVLGAGIPNLIIALSVGAIPGVARLVRNQVLSLREMEYIESEKAMGASDCRTIVRHILPACYSFLLVRFTSGLAGSVLSMTSLSYLGLGLDPTVPSWGGIVYDGQSVMFTCPHVVFYAALTICLTVFGFSILGDGVRDLLDPKLR